MIKKGVALIFIGLFLFSLVASIGVVSAEGFFSTNVIDPIKTAFTGEGTLKLSTATMRLFFFALIVILIFSVLTTAKFPEQSFVRVLISAVVGFLAIVYVTPAEFYALMQSYTALGIALAFFLPILILIFFTLVVGERAAFALVFTRALWFIYSIYIFWKGLVIYVVLDNGGAAPEWLKALYTATIIEGKAAVMAADGTTIVTPAVAAVTKSTVAFTAMIEEAAKQNFIMAIILMGVGAIVFYFGVINHSWIAFFKKEMTKAQVETYKDRVKKSMGFVKSNADAVEDAE